MQLLLSYEEIVVDAEDWDGMTPLMVAALWGWHEIIEMLVPAGADIEGGPSTDYWGDTPLRLAAAWGYDYVVQVSFKSLHSPPSHHYYQLFSGSDRSWSRHRPPNWVQ